MGGNGNVKSHSRTSLINSGTLRYTGVLVWSIVDYVYTARLNRQLACQYFSAKHLLYRIVLNTHVTQIFIPLISSTSYTVPYFLNYYNASHKGPSIPIKLCRHRLSTLARSTADTGTPRDALAPYPWSGSVNWCLVEGWRNGDSRRSVSHWLKKHFTILLCLTWSPRTSQIVK